MFSSLYNRFPLKQSLGTPVVRIFLLWKLWNLPANKAKRGDFDCESSSSLFHDEGTKSNTKA